MLSCHFRSLERITGSSKWRNWFPEEKASVWTKTTGDEQVQLLICLVFLADYPPPPLCTAVLALTCPIRSVSASACACQEGVCGGLPALRLLRLGERAVLCLLRWLPEGVRGGDPVTLPALWADGHGGGQQQLQLGGDGEGLYLG